MKPMRLPVALLAIMFHAALAAAPVQVMTPDGEVAAGAQWRIGDTAAPATPAGPSLADSAAQTGAIASSDWALIELTDFEGKSWGPVTVPAQWVDSGRLALVLQTGAIHPDRTDAAAPRLQAGPWTLGGSIQGGNSPLAGANVYLTDAATQAEIGQTVTDSAGSYSFAVSDGTYKLRILPDPGTGFGESIVSGIVVNGANVTQNVVLMQASVALRGVLKTPQGVPIDNAYMILTTEGGAHQGQGWTSRTGTFSFLVSPGYYKLSVQANGINIRNVMTPDSWYIRDLATNIPVSRETTVELVVPFSRLSGQTLDGEGHPVPNAPISVQLDDADSHWTFRYEKNNYRSGVDGHFDLALLPRNSTIVVDPPTSSTLGPTIFEDVLITTDTVRSLVLEPGLSLTGILQSPGGVLLDNVRVDVFQESSGVAMTNFDLASDSSGSLSIRLTAGQYRLTLIGSGPEIKNVLTPLTWQTELVVDLTTSTLETFVVPMVRLIGRALDPEGEPVAGAEFFISGIGVFGTNPWLRTDPEGRIDILTLAGSYNISLVPPANSGLGTLGVIVDLTTDTTTTFQFEKSVRFEGNLVHPDGIAISGGDVHIYGAPLFLRGPHLQHTTVNSEGTFVANLKPGSYGFKFGGNQGGNSSMPSSWAFDFREFSITSDTQHSFLLPFLTVTGRTTDGNGVGVPGVTFRAHGLGWTDDLYRECFFATGDVLSDSLGRFKMYMLEHDYEERIIPPDGSGFGAANLNFHLSSSVRQDIVLNLPDMAPPRIVSGPFVNDITARTAMVEWRTDEMATSVLSYGTVSPPTYEIELPGLRTEHALPLDGLTSNTLYYVQVLGSDESGNGPVSSAITSFRTRADDDVTSPVIVEGPAITPTGCSGRTIVEWLTDEPATSLCAVAAPASDAVITSMTELVKIHRMELAGLTPGIEYSLRVGSADRSGNGPSWSAWNRFTMPSDTDSSPPLIVQGPLAIDISDGGATIEWVTDEPASSGVSWNDGTRYGLTNDEAPASRHSVRLTGLLPGTTYNYTVSSTDACGNGPTISETLHFTTRATPDIRPPDFLHGPVVVNTTHQSAVIRWTTDEPSNSRIGFGKTPDLGSTVSRTAMVRNHNLTLVGLEGNTLYRFRAGSTDTAGNTTETTLLSFKTDALPDTQSPRFLETPRIAHIDDRSITLRWRTDEPADALIEYGSGTELDQKMKLARRAHEQIVTLSRLAAGTDYTYRITATDLAGNSVTSINGSHPADAPALAAWYGFTTASAPDATPPAIVEGPSAVSISATRALVRWVTSEIADTRLNLDPGLGTLSPAGGDIMPTTEHFVLLTNIVPGSLNRFQAGSRDCAGNGPVWSGIQMFLAPWEADRAAPVFVASPTAEPTTDRTGLVIRWRTGEYCTTTVRYGTDPSDLRYSVTIDGWALAHAITLPSLRPGQVVYYQVIGADIEGNASSTAVLTATAPLPSHAAHWPLYE